jgi:hypothetical protein
LLRKGDCHDRPYSHKTVRNSGDPVFKWNETPEQFSSGIAKEIGLDRRYATLSGRCLKYCPEKRETGLSDVKTQNITLF